MMPRSTMSRKDRLTSLSLALLIGQAWLAGGCRPVARLELPGSADTLELSFLGDASEPARGSRGAGPKPRVRATCSLRGLGVAQNPAELVLEPGRVWARGRVWTGEGVAVAYQLARAPLALPVWP